MPEMTLGERICQLREGKGWIQRELALQMDVKANTISNWEKGISRPSVDQVVQLCQVLSVTSDSLLGLDQTAMKRTLNLKEQAIIKAYRNLSPEMQNNMFHFFSGINQYSLKLFKAETLCSRADDFAQAMNMNEEWEEEKKLLREEFDTDDNKEQSKSNI